MAWGSNTSVFDPDRFRRNMAPKATARAKQAKRWSAIETKLKKTPSSVSSMRPKVFAKNPGRNDLEEQRELRTIGKSGNRKTKAVAAKTIAARNKKTGNPNSRVTGAAGAGAPAAAPAAAPAPDFNTILNQVNAANQYVPDYSKLNAAQNATRAAMADRRMLDSTMYGSLMGDVANEDARRQFEEQEKIRQFNTQVAMRMYEMLTSKVLQEAQIRGGFENLSTQYPNMPAFSPQMQNYVWPSYNPTSNAGDPVSSRQGWTGFTPAGGPTIQKQQLNASVAEANSRIALQRRALELEEEKWKEQKKQLDKENDIWGEMASIAVGNFQTRENPQTGAIERYGVLNPSTILNTFKGKYGVDIEAMIQGAPDDPNTQRARGIYATLYPKSAAKKFKLLDTGTKWEDVKTQWNKAGTEDKGTAGSEARSPFGRLYANFGLPAVGANVASSFRSTFGKSGKSYQELMNEYYGREFARLQAERKVAGLNEPSPNELNFTMLPASSLKKWRSTIKK